MNTRRRLLYVLGTTAYAPRALFAQAKKQPVLIGWLSIGRRGQGVRSPRSSRDSRRWAGKKAR